MRHFYGPSPVLHLFLCLSELTESAFNFWPGVWPGVWYFFGGVGILAHPWHGKTEVNTKRQAQLEHKAPTFYPSLHLSLHPQIPRANTFYSSKTCSRVASSNTTFQGQKCSISALSNMVAASRIWLSIERLKCGVTKDPNF